VRLDDEGSDSSIPPTTITNNTFRVRFAGSEAYTTTNFGDSSGSHGAFEMAELSSNGASIVLSGLCKKTNLDEMAFKSYGNVPGGTGEAKAGAKRQHKHCIAFLNN